MKKILALIMALAIAFAAVACTSTPSTTAPEAEATEAAAEATAAPVEEAAAAAEKLMGGEITIGTNVDVATNASWRIRSGQEKLMLGGIYEPLLRFDENGDLQPYLAESVTADQAALTYTVKLREGLTFSDGSALDADALLWNFQNFKENSQTSATHFGDVESFEKTDDLTVVIHLAAWNTQIPYSLNSVAGLMYSKQAFDENGYDWCLENPVGTGPYMLQEVVTDDYKVLVKNPNEWNTEEPATFAPIRFKIIADQISAQAAYARRLPTQSTPRRLPRRLTTASRLFPISMPSKARRSIRTTSSDMATT
jgi:peptide/nickel transport system substrate-binding protein